MATARDVLNELKWRHDALEAVQITYRHRGAPNDEAVLTGARIEDLGRSFIQAAGPAGGLSLPYHRVLRVELDGRVVWERHLGAHPA